MLIVDAEASTTYIVPRPTYVVLENDSNPLERVNSVPPVEGTTLVNFSSEDPSIDIVPNPSGDGTNLTFGSTSSPDRVITPDPTFV